MQYQLISKIRTAALPIFYALHGGGSKNGMIQPRNDAPSMDRDFVQAGHAGLHHIAY